MMGFSADRKDYTIETKNELTSTEPERYVTIKLSLGLSSGRDNVVLHPCPTMRDKRADGNHFYNPFKSISEELQQKDARLCISTIDVLRFSNDVSYDFHLQIKDIFSTKLDYRSNMPTKKDYQEESRVFNEGAPESTNMIEMMVPRSVAINATSPHILYESITPTNVLETHGGFENAYSVQETKSVIPDGDGPIDVKEAEYQLYDITHPIVADAYRLSKILDLDSGISRVTVDKVPKLKLTRKVDAQIKETVLQGIFDQMRYTDFHDSKLECVIPDELQKKLNSKYMKVLKNRDVTGYIPSVEVVLRVQGVRVRNGVPRVKMQKKLIEKE